MTEPMGVPEGGAIRPGDGRLALVTGGTDGIGKEVARGLGRGGAQVLLVGRDEGKGRRAEEELRASTANDGIFFIRADLGLMREVERLAVEIGRRAPALHTLVHSAGIVRRDHALTKEGIESNFAVNFLSRFALTTRLLPNLQAAGKPGRAARVVMVSGAARHGRVHFDDVNLSGTFTTVGAVRQFCAANDLFTIELARRLADPNIGSRVTVSCLKLGVVKTGIRRGFPGWMKVLVPLVMDPLFGQTAQQAAQGVLGLVWGPEFEGMSGALFLQIRKFKRIFTRADADPHDGARLWRLSEEIISRATTDLPNRRWPATPVWQRT
jgi:NAD(P)-dependent dehydrogenase (short-subunit alcohol dehydrogenase family)